MTQGELFDTLLTATKTVYEPTEAHATATLLAEELFGITRCDVISHPEKQTPDTPSEQLLQRIRTGEPMQYITGSTLWHGMRLQVGDGVLIPRPETEQLVDLVLAENGDGGRIIDFGTGSGAIAIALAKALPQSRVEGIDLSDKALAWARRNAEAQGVKVDFERGDMLDFTATHTYDIMVSNPPYVPQSDISTMHRNVRDFEPHSALFVPDNDPLLFYRALARTALSALNVAGSLYCEFYEHYADAMVEMFTAEGLCGAEVRHDMFGKPRMIRWTKR